jgi:hypothetical protein
MYSFHVPINSDVQIKGQLYLGVFSGPVEGIIMIVTIFIITGFTGTSKIADYDEALNPV